MHTHTKHTKGGCTSFERKEKVGKVYFVLFLNAKRFPRKLLRMYIYDMPGQKRDIMKRKMSVFVCLSFSLYYSTRARQL